MGGGPPLAGELAAAALQDDQIHHVLDECAVVFVESVDPLDLLEEVEVGDRGLRGAVGGNLGEVVEGDADSGLTVRGLRLAGPGRAVPP